MHTTLSAAAADPHSHCADAESPGAGCQRRPKTRRGSTSITRRYMQRCRVTLIPVVVLFIVAASMATASVIVLTRANPDQRLSWWRQPPRTPTSVRVFRGLAGGSAVFGAISLGDRVAVGWGVALIFAVFLPALLLQTLHNRRAKAEPVR